MYFPPPPFDLAEARLCALLVDAAYDMSDQWEAQGRPRRETRFEWRPTGPQDMSYSDPVWGAPRLLHFFREPAPFGFVSWRGATGYLVLRGTQTPSDVIQDLRADQEPYSRIDGWGEVHEGFEDVYQGVAVDLLNTLSALPPSVGRLVVTGHSMGSAIATLALPEIPMRTRFGSHQLIHYNLASPRVGGPEFAARYAALRVPTYRVVNDSDLVTQVPPPVFGRTLYQHVGVPVTFNVQRGSIEGNHSAKEVYLPALEGAA
ncbi:MAG: lipase family protein [Planctomycetota bacterium]